MKVFLSGPSYRDRPAALAYAQRLIERVGQIPGVQAVALTNGSGSGAVNLDGPPRFRQGHEPLVFFHAVSSGYSQVVGIPLVKGRWTTEDEPVPAVMVNETFVRRVFGRDEPLGQRLRIMDGALATIVGVVGDLKISRLDADPDPEVWIPYKQILVFRRLDVLIKTLGAPATILPEVRKVVQQLDPTQPPYGITALEGAPR
jgi:MacB-like periplasmic core domain